jgi:pimeloyl-ACP methyl ester carboxylesterase
MMRNKTLEGMAVSIFLMTAKMPTSHRFWNLFMSQQKNINIHFAHANGFPAGCYGTLIEQLSRHFTCLAIPKLGHDPKYPVHNNWVHQVTEIADYINDNQEPDSSLYLVGHSLGGVLSYLLACQLGTKVSGLILLDPPLIMGSSRLLFKMVKRTPLINILTPAKLAKKRRCHWPKDVDLNAYFKQRKLFHDFDERCLTDYVKTVCVPHKGHWKLDFDANVEAQFFQSVPDNINRFSGQLVCPSLLVTATQSKVCSGARRNAFLRKNPMEHMEHSGGHMFPFEYPDEVAQLLINKISHWAQVKEN